MFDARPSSVLALHQFLEFSHNLPLLFEELHSKESFDQTFAVKYIYPSYFRAIKNNDIAIRLPDFFLPSRNPLVNSYRKKSDRNLLPNQSNNSTSYSDYMASILSLRPCINGSCQLISETRKFWRLLRS
jgi:hypothetical protein